MEVYKVGEVFPDKQYMGMEGCGIRFTKVSFDVLFSAANIVPAEVKEWTTGKLTYGLYIDQLIPFFILKLGDNYLSDCSFNILLMDPIRAEEWLGQGKPEVNILMLEKNSYLLKAIRSFDVDAEFMKLLKTTLRKQTNQFISHEMIERKIITIQNRLNPEKMFKNCTLFRK
jgi:hypothetical protein